MNVDFFLWIYFSLILVSSIPTRIFTSIIIKCQRFDYKPKITNTSQPRESLKEYFSLSPQNINIYGSQKRRIPLMKGLWFCLCSELVRVSFHSKPPFTFPPKLCVALLSCGQLNTWHLAAKLCSWLLDQCPCMMGLGPEETFE